MIFHTRLMLLDHTAIHREIELATRHALIPLAHSQPFKQEGSLCQGADKIHKKALHTVDIAWQAVNW